MGLPCPNIFAGGHNFHGRYEYVPVESMMKAIEVIVKYCATGWQQKISCKIKLHKKTSQQTLRGFQFYKESLFLFYYSAVFVFV